MPKVKTNFKCIYIDPEALKKMQYWTDAAKGEVSGLGTLSIDKDGDIIINKAYILEQESTSADTELDPDAISKLMLEMMQNDEEVGDLKFWWHSHASMSVFWSGTDDTCCETLGTQFSVSIVINKNHETKCRMDVYSPIRMTIDDIEVKTLEYEDEELKEQCKKDVEEKVREKSYSNWRANDKHCNPADYDGYGGYPYGRNFGHTSNEKKLDLTESQQEDAEKLLDLIEESKELGGIFSPEMWKKYIFDRLKTLAEKRFESTAHCKSFGTFDATWGGCKGECKTIEQCRYWTTQFAMFDKTEEEIDKEIDGEIEGEVVEVTVENDGKTTDIEL